MPECPYCETSRDCKNDLLFHIVKDHDANMEAWPR